MKRIIVIIIFCFYLILSNNSTVFAQSTGCTAGNTWTGACGQAGSGCSSTQRFMAVCTNYEIYTSGNFSYWQYYCQNDSTCNTTSPGCSDWCAGADQCYASGGTQVGRPCSFAFCSTGTSPCLAPPPAPPCNTAPPGAAFPSAPADSYSPPLDTNTVNLNWTDTSGWGVGCPGTQNVYNVFYSPGCNGTYIQNSNPNVKTLTNLTWGINYCWYVQKFNGSLSSNSPISHFSINAPPTITSQGIISTDICGKGYSGKYDNRTTTSNPITYSVTFNDTDSGTYKEVWLALAPTSGTYAISGDPIASSVMNSNVGASGSIGVKIDLTTNNVYTLTSSGAWDATGTVTGSKTNAAGTATILGINTAGATQAIVSGSTMTATFQIKFNDSPTPFPSGTYNIYAAALSQTGTYQETSYATTTNPTVYKNTGSSWKVDVVPPTTSISGFAFNQDSTFNLTYNASDNVSGSGINVLNSYVWSNTANTGLDDNTLPLSIRNIPTAQGTPNLGITLANIGQNGGVHNYAYPASVPTSRSADFTYRLSVADNACNTNYSTQIVNSPTPWIMAYQGSISSNGGIKSIKVPSVTNLNIPNLNITDTSNLSTYSALSGTVDLPTSNQSKQNEYSQNYLNDVTTPPIEATTINDTTPWYNYLLNQVTKNNKTTIIPFNTSQVINGGNISNALSAGGGTPTSYQWVRNFGSTLGNSYIYSVAQLNDGNFVVAGFTTVYTGAYDLYYAKLDQQGNLLWEKKWGGSGSDVAMRVKSTTDGGFVIAGYSNSVGFGNYDAILLKFDTNGNLTWAKNLGGTVDDYAFGVIQTADGGYVIVGTSASYTSTYATLMAKFDTNGNLLWSKLTDATGTDELEDVKEASNGNLYTVGFTTSFHGNYDVLFQSYTSNGTLQMTGSLGNFSLDDLGISLVLTSDGNMAIAGYTSGYGAGNYDIYLAKLSLTGTLLWTKTYGSAQNDYGWSLIQTKDGGLAVGGFGAYTGTTNIQMFVLKTQSDGTFQWVSMIGGNGNEDGRGLVQSSDGNYVIAGLSPSFSGNGTLFNYVAKLDSTGNCNGCADVSPGLFTQSNGGAVALGSFTSIANGSLGTPVISITAASSTFSKRCDYTTNPTGSSANTKGIVTINGNLTINSGTVCDMKAMIFVSGTTTINPDFTQTLDNGCSIVSKGDITINNGTQKTNGVTMGSSTPASYDNVYAELVTDGTLHTTLDNAPGGGYKWDGVFISGGVVAKNLDLQRDLDNFANYTQPSHFFVYDPRYRQNFKDDLALNKFMIREVK